MAVMRAATAASEAGGECLLWAVHDQQIDAWFRNAAIDPMTAMSPICEFIFLAARARRTENAASVKLFGLPGVGKTGHSCQSQQDQFSELTECGQSDYARPRLPA